MGMVIVIVIVLVLLAAVFGFSGPIKGTFWIGLLGLVLFVTAVVNFVSLYNNRDAGARAWPR